MISATRTPKYRRAGGVRVATGSAGSVRAVGGALARAAHAVVRGAVQGRRAGLAHGPAIDRCRATDRVLDLQDRAALERGHHAGRDLQVDGALTGTDHGGVEARGGEHLRAGPERLLHLLL